MLAEILTVAVATSVIHSISSRPNSKAERAKQKYRMMEYEKKQAEIAKQEELERQRQEQIKTQAELERQKQELIKATVEEEKQQRKARAKERKAVLKQMYAKFAICYYIAQADGRLAPQEKEELNRMCLDIYNMFPKQEVKNELLKIYNTPDMNFIKLEKYILDVDPIIIGSFLTLAEETASLDGNATDAERECVYKLRKYLTEKTGTDYLGNTKHFDSALDLQCPGCGSNMRLVRYENTAVCPCCGHITYLQTAK